MSFIGNDTFREAYFIPDATFFMTNVSAVLQDVSFSIHTCIKDYRPLFLWYTIGS